MPHTRAKKRAKLRELKKADNPDDFFYCGHDCSCGQRLYCWAISRSPKEPPIQLSTWLGIEPPSCRGRQFVIAHTAEDAQRALAGIHVEHDAYIAMGNQHIPRLAHDRPCGTVLIADFGCNGAYGEGIRDLVLAKHFAECQVIQSVAKLEERLWYLLPGDYFIGKLCEMKAGGCYSDAEAVEFIEELEDRLLPKGARAILDATSIYSQALNDTIELCLGRIQLVHSPTAEQVHSLVAAMRAE